MRVRRVRMCVRDRLMRMPMAVLPGNGDKVGMRMVFVVMAVAVGFFPPHLRSSAIGIAVAVARLGAIGGPMLGGLVIGAGASTSLFFVLAVAPACLCIVGALLISRALRIAKAMAEADAVA